MLGVSLSAKTAAGAAWHLGAGIAVRGIGIVGTLVLTRFLDPAAYGEVLLAAACLITVGRLLALCLPSYVIAHRSQPEEVFQAALTHVLVSVVGLGAVTLFRRPLAAALGSPGMASYLPALALALVLNQLAAIPAATLARSLRFRVTAAARVAGEAAYTGVSISLAPFAGGSAIVAGNVARYLLSSSIILWRSDRSEWWHPARPRWAIVKKQLAFGLPLAGGGIAATVYGYGDSLMVSRLFGPTAVGLYTLGVSLATTPTDYVSDSAGDVLLSGLSAVTDAERRRGAFLRALAVIPMIVFPIAFGLAAVAPTLVGAFLDHRWAALGVMVPVLSGIAVGRTITSVAGPYLLSNRRPRALLALGWLRACALVFLVVTVGWRGPLWVCAAAALAALLEAVGSLVAVSHGEGISLRLLGRALSPSLFASALMVVTVLGLRVVSGGIRPLWLWLAIEVSAGAIAYIAAATVFARPHVDDLLGVLRALLDRRRAVAPEAAACENSG